MGAEYSVRCLHCGHTFTVRQGGGFFFHLLHCDTCGEDVSIGFDELGEAHVRYIKGLPGPYCVASGPFDREIQERYPGTPLSEGEYHRVVAQIAGGAAVVVLSRLTLHRDALDVDRKSSNTTGEK